MTPTEFDILARARDGLLSAQRGAKALLIAQTAQALGCSVPTVYRKLAEAGLDTQRKQRSDAGESVLSADQLRLVAGVLLASANKHGQRMPVATALDMLRASGQIAQAVHESTVSRQLYQRRLHPEQLSNPTPSLQMRSLHPNHVWQIDSTTGAYYYLPGGRLRWMDEAEFYKGKALPAKLKQQLDANDAATEAQRVLIDNQKAELVRVNRLYDVELARLKRLWAGAAPGTLDGPIK
jgi:hypothetical protein